MKTTWDESKTLEIPIAWEPADDGQQMPGHWYDCAYDQPLPHRVEQAIGRRNLCEGSIIINYRVRGWYDPGKTSGPPERCYPPEGDNEVLLDNVHLRPDAGATSMQLSTASAQAVLDEYMDLIYELEDIRC